MPLDSVLGQRIAAGGRELEIIGVVGDVALDVYGAPTMVVYHAHRQFADEPELGAHAGRGDRAIADGAC